MTKAAQLVEEANKTKKTDLLLVDPRNIEVDEDFNVRQDYGDIESLKKSIIENGQIDPVYGSKVRGEDKYLLTDGFRRMRAIKLAIEAGFDIPYVKLIVTSGNVEDRIFTMVITGTDKKPLTLLEEAEAYKRLVAYQYKPKDIAAKIGKSKAHVYNLLQLAEAPKAVKNAIEGGEISGTTVVNIIREVKNPDELIQVVNQSIADAKKGGENRKATSKNIDGVTKLLTPLQKLAKAYEIVEKSGGENLELLNNIIDLLNKKESTPKQLANLFK